MVALEKEPLPVIAIDGPAGSGKSTTAKAVARRLGWRFIDTGAMYRALALAVMEAGGDPEREADVRPVLERVNITLGFGENPPVYLEGEDVSPRIRTPEVSQGASQVSVHPFVRKRMVQLQRQLGLSAPSVLEGRDTTTMIFPDAGLKIYLEGSVEVRAKRRLRDYEAQGKSFTLEEVIADVESRDARDAGRKEGPLAVAPDAEVIDTTGLNLQAQIEAVLDVVKQRFPGVEVTEE